MPKDWFEWHDLYQTDSGLQQRLEIVRKYISSSLDAVPPGIVRVVSACAGDGRDLLGTLSGDVSDAEVYFSAGLLGSQSRSTLMHPTHKQFQPSHSPAIAPQVGLMQK